MKKSILLCLLAGFSFLAVNVKAQDAYVVSSGEMLFQWSEITLDDEDIKSNMRWTVFFHLGQYINIDFNDNFGIFSGLAVRNVGFITDHEGVKVKYRSYALGLPLAIKLGSFKNNTYVFAGAEYEWLFHFKQKTFTDSGKQKYSEWFSSRTPSLIPSVFGGMQFPGGVHLTFKYYLENFLNHNFKKEYASGPVDDYSKFGKTQVFYISLGMWIPYEKMRKSVQKNSGTQAGL